MTSLNTARGIVLKISTVLIDKHFAEKTTKFKHSCNKFGDILKRFHKLEIQIENRFVPKHVLNAMKKLNPTVDGDQQFLENVGLALMHTNLDTLLAELLDWETTHIGQPTSPQDQCLNYMREQFDGTMDLRDLTDISAIQILFHNQHRSTIFHYFMNAAETYNEDVHFGLLSKMLHSVEKEVQKTRDFIAKSRTVDVSMDEDTVQSSDGAAQLLLEQVKTLQKQVNQLQSSKLLNQKKPKTKGQSNNNPKKGKGKGKNSSGNGTPKTNAPAFSKKSTGQRKGRAAARKRSGGRNTKQ